MNAIAIIPARGGSKGLPGKNIRTLGGKPLLAWSIEAALAAACVERVFVSTDSPEIASVASAWGAETIMRPAAISGDTASSESALLHALDYLRGHNAPRPEILVFLQCTSPFTSAEDIEGTVAALLEQKADSALSVTPFGHFLWRKGDAGANGINHDGKTRLRRQDLPPQYLENGAVYAMRTACFEREKTRFCGKTALFVSQGEEKSLEIDTAGEFFQAEIMCRWLAKPSREREDYRLAGATEPRELGGVVFDFDGVFTANDVWIDQEGRESVRCSRGDGLGIAALRQRGVPMLVLSSEENPVVAARCAKLGLEYRHGVSNKSAWLQGWLQEKGLSPSQILYLGNDLNDAACLGLVGWPVVPADAHEAIKPLAKHILHAKGGHGAVRELCDSLCAALDAGRLSLVAPGSREKGYFIGQCDVRPWGKWEVLAVGEGYCIKKIMVNPGGQLSYQYHRYRDEVWKILHGTGAATIDGKIQSCTHGDILSIPNNTNHLLHNTGNDCLVFIEIQSGKILSEDDIVRLSDMYGRQSL